MRFSPRLLALAAAVLLSACRSSAPPEQEGPTAVDPNLEKEIHSLISQLRGRYDIEQDRIRESLVLVGKPAIPYLMSACKNEDPGVRAHSAMALGGIGDPAGIPAILPLVDDPHFRVRMGACRALGELGGPEAGEPAHGWAGESIYKCLRGATYDERMVAAEGIRQAHYEPAIPRLIALLTDPNPETRVCAQDALQAITAQNFRMDVRAWEAWWQDAKQASDDAGLPQADVFHFFPHLHATPAEIDRARLHEQEMKRRLHGVEKPEQYFDDPEDPSVEKARHPPRVRP
ncbi:MAG: HEAT repeat domain-containing protein [Planctomycetota bacterium]